MPPIRTGASRAKTSRQVLGGVVHRPVFWIGAAGLVLVLSISMWYQRTELQRVRAAALQALEQRNVSTLYSLTDPSERAELNLTEDGMRLMLEETLWRHGATRHSLVAPWVMQEERGRVDWIVSWDDATGRRIEVPLANSQSITGQNGLYSVITFNKRDQGWRLNFTALIWGMCYSRLARPGGGEWYRDLCRRSKISGRMNEYMEIKQYMAGGS